MYQFQRYDPAQPRTVTSFKGNQKLIFEGYRYNIHHIVQAKGVKTWRCVCAKKLTCSRSWCKGRAETWDDDGQGISKGEHNHPAEHEIAELEYFKSQLILAAIASPNANLNDLIDEAIGFMSDGVSFGSRDSLKKSLTVARKTVENGGFKLKCYKNSDKPFKSLVYNNIVQPQQQQKKQEQSLSALSNGGTAEMPKKTMPSASKSAIKAKCQNTNMANNNSNAHVMTLLSLAKQCRENRMEEKDSPFTATTVSPSSCCPPSAASLSLLDSSGFHSNSSLNCSPTCPSPSSLSNSSPSSTFLFAAVAAAAAAALNNNKSNNNLTKKGGMALIGPKKRMENGKMEAKLSGHGSAAVSAVISTVTESRSNPTSTGTSNCIATMANGTSGKNSQNNQLHNAQIVQRKKARVNSIFDKLSTKAAAAAATSASSSTEQQRRNIQFNVAETQTDNDGTEEVEDSAAEHPNKGESWRVVRICCCGDSEKCTRGQKRKWAASPAGAGDFDDNATTIGTAANVVEEHSPPPSTSSSVENQPQQNGIIMAEEKAIDESAEEMAKQKRHGECC